MKQYAGSRALIPYGALFCALLALAVFSGCSMDNPPPEEEETVTETPSPQGKEITPGLDRPLSFSPASVSLQLGSAASASVSANSGFDGYQWYVDGEEKSPVGTSRTFALKGNEFTNPGVHYLGVRAAKDGVSYHAEMSFTVTP
jgi:hypothetical protein